MPVDLPEERYVDGKQQDSEFSGFTVQGLVLWNRSDVAFTVMAILVIGAIFLYNTKLIVLVFSSRKSQAPKAEGIPYDQGAR